MNGINYTHLHYEQQYLRRSDGSKLRICVYRPKTKFAYETASADSSSVPVPGILWIHGGGFALESPELEVFYFQKIVDATNAVLVAPDYRKSTEAPYPAALEDCYWTLLWLKDHAKQLGVRSDQLVVVGASAGGNLTAAVSLLARDRKDVNIAFQVPICPMLDDRETPSSYANDAPVWNTASNRLCWNMYLGNRKVPCNVPAYAAPARAQDLSGLPPTLSYVGDIEPFYDETVTYMNRLAAAGVETRFRVFPGAFHVFDALVPHAGISEDATNFLLDGFLYGIRHYSAVQH
ncbi:alpha/beta hydrolase [Bifidobacterium sp. ESL0784]|uniref:alpha/beta hydrolase n=1 Tax=Bifidobacterium sp. ESL0784 TaxID=2983231 RepID=UPI0023F7B0DD|nr:alpha/beta hydrolase [Bifidobacterium sp. ESL0784]MDF7640127.1 alpha/beta hydrolase [Bifidobacterium sp. ESL0784]